MSRLHLSGSNDVIGHVTIESFMPFPRGAHCPVVTKSLSRAAFEIRGLKDIGVMTLTFQGHVTSSFDPR